MLCYRPLMTTGRAHIGMHVHNPLIHTPEGPNLNANIVDDDGGAGCTRWLTLSAGPHSDKAGNQQYDVFQTAWTRIVANQLIILYDPCQLLLQGVRSFALHIPLQQLLTQLKSSGKQLKPYPLKGGTNVLVTFFGALRPQCVF